MLVIVKENYDAMSEEAARLVADRLRKKPNMVPGLATGSTPLGLYRELIRMHRDEGLDFSKVTTFRGSRCRQGRGGGAPDGNVPCIDHSDARQGIRLC